MVRRAELYGGALAGEDVGGRTQRARGRRSTTARGEGSMARGARGGRSPARMGAPAEYGSSWLIRVFFLFRQIQDELDYHISFII
jgi:hypothetical protein